MPDRSLAYRQAQMAAAVADAIERDAGKGCVESGVWPFGLIGCTIPGRHSFFLRSTAAPVLPANHFQTSGSLQLAHNERLHAFQRTSLGKR